MPNIRKLYVQPYGLKCKMKSEDDENFSYIVKSQLVLIPHRTVQLPNIHVTATFTLKA